MNSKLILLLLLLFLCNSVIGQSKKELRATVLRLQTDSVFIANKLQENALIISDLNSEISRIKPLNEELKQQNEKLSTTLQVVRDSLFDAISHLDNLEERVSREVDSIYKYSRISDFINSFYASLETSEEEDLRQHEYGDLIFDIENFNSMVSKDARYNKQRVKNLCDQKTHHKYFIMLESIEEIKFSLDKILVRTKVMYSGENMGLFYNEEQLTLNEYKGLLKLTDWVDLDLYKIAPTIEWNDDNFTREDFYKWIDGTSR